MFSLFSSNKDKRVADPRKSVVEAPRTARPWPFLAASPPVQRAPPRRSLSLPQHVAIFSDTQYLPRSSITSNYGSSAENSPGANTPTRPDLASSPRREELVLGNFMAAPSSGESMGSSGSGNVSVEAEYRQDKRQLRTSLVPDLF